MIVLFGLLGLIFGSFYLVIGTRLPLKDNVLTGRSRCDNCHHSLSWYDLIPIISFLSLKGKCRYCHNKISINHLLIEILTSILFIIGYLYYGLNYEYFIYLILISVTILIFITDSKYMIILDSPLIIGSILIILIYLYNLDIYNTLSYILSGVLLFLTMYGIKLLGDFLFKKESLGGGDIKLEFLVGLVLGYKLGLVSIVFASFLALPYALTSVYLNKKNELPFGPFLISSSLIIYLFIDKFTRLLIFFF